MTATRISQTVLLSGPRLLVGLTGVALQFVAGHALGFGTHLLVPRLAPVLVVVIGDMIGVSAAGWLVLRATERRERMFAASLASALGAVIGGAILAALPIVRYAGALIPLCLCILGFQAGVLSSGNRPTAAG